MKLIRRSSIALIMCLSTFSVFAQKPVLTVDAGHSGPVYSVCFSPDGKYVLSGSFDGTLKLWEVATGKMIRTFLGHSSGVNSVCFSPDGLYALSGSKDKTLKLWDISSGREIRTFSGHTKAIKSIAFSPDGKYAASGSGDNSIKLWNVASGEEMRTLDGDFSTIMSVCFSPDGTKLLSGSEDKVIKLWDLATGSVHRFPTQDDAVNAVCFSPDGKYAASAGGTFRGESDPASAYAVKLWNISTGELAATYSGHGRKVNSVRFSPDGRFLLSGSLDNTLKLWDLSSGTEPRSFTSNNHVTITGVASVCFSPDGNYAVSGNEDGTVVMWELASGKIYRICSGHSTKTRSVSFSPDGKYALSCSVENNFPMWDMTTGKVIHIFSGHSDIVLSACFSPDGRYIVSASGDKTLKLWDVATGAEVRTFSGHSEYVAAACFSPDGKYILSGSFDKTAILWDVSTGQMIKSFFGHNDCVRCVNFSPDGMYAITGGYDETAKIWNVATGKEVRSLSTPKGYVWGVSFSPDGKFVLTEDTYYLRLWDISTGQEVRSVAEPEGLFSACFSPDGKYLLSDGPNNTITMRDVLTGDSVKTFSGHTAPISSVRFSPDGKRLLSASSDNSMKLWDVATGAEIVSLFSYKNDWLAITPDLYFDCSKDGGQAVSMVLGNHGYNIDQFALKNNRPDIILGHLGCTDKDLIRHYYNQYKKRLRKSGFTEDQLSTELHVPVAAITEMKQADKFVSVQCTLKDDKYNLKRYNVYVNDVPLFGAYGKDISGQNNLALTEKIELTSGTNKIEISCINEKGVESFRALTYADYNQPVKRDLYYLGFGVSKYKKPGIDLQYADKDALNLAETLTKMQGQYDHVYAKTFTNQDVTVENIKRAKELLKNSKPDDVFILFIAGHGMHDTDPEATYYYLTSNVDLSNLKGTAANFETVEDLLQGIPPRNKLFLMDACESGEIDDDVQTSFIAQAGARGMRSRGIGLVPGSGLKEQAAGGKVKNAGATARGMKTAASTSVPKRAYLYQQNDRYIYNDVARRSGAIVFSSSKGGEFSYERSDIQNGLFTRSILNTLTSAAADKDHDGMISTDELREYVASEVATTSGGLQHPVVDRDNIFQKFGMPIVK